MGAGLYEPLGTRPAAPERRRRLSAPIVVALVVGGAVAIVAAVAIFKGGDATGEPSAVAKIDRVPVATVPPAVGSTPPAVPQAPAQVRPPAAAQAGPAPGPVSGRAADVEVQNGVRIIRMRPEGLPSSTQGLPVPAQIIPAR